MLKQRIVDVVRPLTVQLEKARKFATRYKKNGAERSCISLIDNVIEEVDGEICFVARIFQKLELWEQDMKNRFEDIVKDLDKALEHGTDEKEFHSKLLDVKKETSDFREEMTHASPLFLERLDAYIKSNSYEIPLINISSHQTTSDSVEPLKLQFDGTKSLGQIEENIKKFDKYNIQVLVFLSIFPIGSLIKKRMIYYWWIGSHSDNEELRLNQILAELAGYGLIRHTYKEHKPNVIDCCIINPLVPKAVIKLKEHQTVKRYIDSIYDPLSIRPFLSPSSESNHAIHQSRLGLNNLLGNTCFNVNNSCLKFEREKIENMKEFAILMLGRWQNSFKHHIEVENTEFLTWLGRFNSLRYLSLRGISRIIELPREIGELKSLCVLDLQACYDLQRLPVEIKNLQLLEHLDTSECYFLSHMPRDIGVLSRLKVLKGFVVDHLQRQESCQLGELSKLNILKKLSIYIGRESVLEEGEFRKLNSLTSLVSLTLTWSTGKPPSSNGDAALSTANAMDVSPPPNLKKLDVRCIPEGKLPQWLLPSKLTKLERLYIRGGKPSARTLSDSNLTWPSVKVLRLRFLDKADLEDLIDAFPNLDYVEYHKCDNSEANYHLGRNDIDGFRQTKRQADLDKMKSEIVVTLREKYIVGDKRLLQWQQRHEESLQLQQQLEQSLDRQEQFLQDTVAAAEAADAKFRSSGHSDNKFLEGQHQQWKELLVQWPQQQDQLPRYQQDQLLWRLKQLLEQQQQLLEQQQQITAAAAEAKKENSGRFLKWRQWQWKEQLLQQQQQHEQLLQRQQKIRAAEVEAYIKISGKRKLLQQL